MNPQRVLVRDKNGGAYWWDPHWYPRMPQPARDWRDDIRIGDVLATPGGGHRVVRRALYRRDYLLVSVAFTIVRCSWTHRAYTLCTRNDLKQFGYLPTGARYSLDTDLDKRIAREVGDARAHPDDCREMSCCDVKGIV